MIENETPERKISERKMHLCCLHDYGCCGRNRLGLNRTFLCSDDPTNYGRVTMVRWLSLSDDRKLSDDWKELIVKSLQKGSREKK